MLGWSFLYHFCLVCQSGSCRNGQILENDYSMDYVKLRQVEILCTTAVVNVVSLLEQIYKASCSHGMQPLIY